MPRPRGGPQSQCRPIAGTGDLGRRCGRPRGRGFVSPVAPPIPPLRHGAQGVLEEVGQFLAAFLSTLERARARFCGEQVFRMDRLAFQNVQQRLPARQ